MGFLSGFTAHSMLFAGPDLVTVRVVAIAAPGCYTIGNLRKKEQFHENLA